MDWHVYRCMMNMEHKLADKVGPVKDRLRAIIIIY